MEIELLDGDGRPRAPRDGNGRARRPGDRRRSPTLVATSVGAATACVVLVVASLVAGAVRARATEELDRRVTIASTAQAASVGRSGVLDGSDPDLAVQVLQSPGVVVESTGPPADRVMVARVPPPATTQLSTFGADDGPPTRRYRVAATTLPTQPGVAGRTVVAAALPLGALERPDGPLRVAALALAAVTGMGVALAMRRQLRRSEPEPSNRGTDCP